MNRVITAMVEVDTAGYTDIIDLTPDIVEFIREHQLRDGQLLVFINGSTAAITTIEHEPGLLKDLPEFLEQILPMNKRYHHDDTWHDGNGYAHLRSSLIGPSFTLPVIEGRPYLGTWQQVILVDFDNAARKRRVLLQFVGTSGETD